MFVSVKERVIQSLRGDYNSINYRFSTLPREWLTYFLYRATGRGWIDFYAERLNKGPSQTVHSKINDPEYQKYIASSKAHLEFLKDHGLKEHHRILDYGCGIMRSGIYIIPYVGPGNYVGIDISEARLKRAEELAELKGIPPEFYRLVFTRSCRLTELQGELFDCVWSYSVLHHMPESDILEFLGNLKPLLREGAQVFFSFAPSTTGRMERKRIKDFYYTVEHMRQICESAGYRFSIMPDWTVEDHGDAMARLVLG